ncbi:MAG: tetratricopeptide repeat protein, partial [Actinomycetota bacterium]
FWAAWCGPCRTLSPILERLAEASDGGWVLAKIDVDSEQNLAAAFGVQGIPAVHAFKDGREVDRFVGALPEPQVRAWLQRLGPSVADLAVQEGEAAEARGDRGAALAAYKRALAEEPARADARAAVARLELDERVEHERTSDDPLARADLAFARGDVEQAAKILIEIIRSGEKEPARARLLELLETLPPDDPRALKARRDLAAALF